MELLTSPTCFVQIGELLIIMFLYGITYITARTRLKKRLTINERKK